MSKKQDSVSRLIPEEGISVSLPKGKALTRVHLDAGKDGITLSTVGAASATLTEGNQQRLILKKSTDGLTLAVVGAASAIK